MNCSCTVYAGSDTYSSWFWRKILKKLVFHLVHFPANVKPVGVQVRSSLEDESGSPGVSDHSLEPINTKP
ncbi:Hypothetical predicted protein [Olea europaea subsp. europaea]|uniref:Uncharacterized protein n=1 Tax=Olea europaea subsp. europaea TaxID=158383 RepID=A0A8S0UKT6_OLEEU|nr:Hypothetical predicted protein [Olea europaea subsp. europaea]